MAGVVKEGDVSRLEHRHELLHAAVAWWSRRVSSASRAVSDVRKTRRATTEGE
jgi:hypothetical protein